MNQLVGRVEEKRMLFNCLNSSKSEFVVVYGRRRIGKTFLIRSFFEDKYDFCYVGKHNYAYHDQLKAFAAALKQYSGSKFDIVLNNWDDAFKNLATLLDSITHDGKKIIFIDEMPWIDGRRSDFVPALENFWNSYAAFRDDLMLVACGSSTSWIVDKVLK
ncbi:MAG: AAA family ATPase, partial [Bacteroidales bacterium]|nr:AAA family ATPase [Bacteroidales bacterium]